jgi:hypothetical protein
MSFSSIGSYLINAPIAPVASLSSDLLCYDTVNRATLVVSVTGGTGTLSYSLDGPQVNRPITLLM